MLDLGKAISFWICMLPSVVIGIIFYVERKKRKSAENKKKLMNNALMLTFIIVIAPTILSYTLLFPVIHSVVNLISCIRSTAGYSVLDDLKSGGLPLRYVSLALAYSGAKEWLDHRKRRIEHKKRIKEYMGDLLPPLEGEHWMSQLDRTYRHQLEFEKAIGWNLVRQQAGTFFAAVCCLSTINLALWGEAFSSSDGTTFAAVSWIAAFAMNDWSIYASLKANNVTKELGRLYWRFLALLFVTTVVYALEIIRDPSVISYFVLALLLLWLYCLFNSKKREQGGDGDAEEAV